MGGAVRFIQLANIGRNHSEDASLEIDASEIFVSGEVL
jgi:hypothetical protein